MAKKKEEPQETKRVELVNPDEVINLPRIGMMITKDNLTWERYQRLINISPSFKSKFKTNEVQTKE